MTHRTLKSCTYGHSFTVAKGYKSKQDERGEAHRWGSGSLKWEASVSSPHGVGQYHTPGMFMSVTAGRLIQALHSEFLWVSDCLNSWPCD